MGNLLHSNRQLGKYTSTPITLISLKSYIVQCLCLYVSEQKELALKVEGSENYQKLWGQTNKQTSTNDKEDQWQLNSKSIISGNFMRFIANFNIVFIFCILSFLPQPKLIIDRVLLKYAIIYKVEKQNIKSIIQI